MNKPAEKETRITLGITHGDMNGIGYEVILKNLVDPRIFELFTPVLYGSAKIASYHRKTLNIGEVVFNQIKSADQASSKKLNIVNIINNEVKVELGKPSPAAGELAFKSLEAAVEDFKNGLVDALVTAPINKNSIQSDSFSFPGHTEYFASKFNVSECLMIMVKDNLRIAVVTGHVPVSEISKKISQELISAKLNIFYQSLQQDFAIRKPRIAVLGLNPHAGDEGVIGNEEQDVIVPVIESFRKEGKLVFGPYPADSFFSGNQIKSFDGVLAMYHDQGLIPFKTIAMNEGVNFTAGLPVVRTSPAHGTAFEIAGKNVADPDSFRHAMYLAADIVKNRQEYKELNNSPLNLEIADEGPENDQKMDF